jgi:CrcB protein
MNRILLVMAGGAAGSLLRYLAGLAVLGFFPRFPLGTLLVNITGSFAIGVLMTRIGEPLAPANLRLFWVVGFLGGYTTFSTFEWETYLELRHGTLWAALAYVGASVFLGFAALLGGVALAERMR